MPTPSPSLHRRSVLLGLAAALAVPGGARAAGAGRDWDLGTQILAGARLKDPTVLALALDGLAAEIGKDRVDRLLRAVLARDAADIVDSFEDAQTEAAARRFVEIVYTGDIPAGPGGKPAMLGFHQSLAWQVLHFTKPPSICGPGFGWWNFPPDVG